MITTTSASNAIWANWSTTASTVVTAAGTWGAWNQQYLITPVITGNVTWHQWNGQLHAVAPVAETPQQQAAREERARQYAEDLAGRQRTRARAASRALALLMSFLDDEQQRSYRDDGWFDITGSRGRRWRIEACGQAGNVLLLPAAPDAAEADAFCCHPPGGLPDADAHLAQMLHLVTDEEGFMRTANPAGRRRLQAVA
jgi:hypothetical protein